MKRDIGELSFGRFFIVVVPCLALGFIVYTRFSFVQRPTPQDATQVQVKAVEDRVAGLESRIDGLERKLDRALKRPRAPSPRPVATRAP